MKRTLVIIMLMLTLVLGLTGCDSSDYKKAVELQEAGNYEEAAVIFGELAEYEDSQVRLEECNEMIEIIADYLEAKEVAESKTAEFDKAVKSAEELALNEPTALDETCLPTLKETITAVKEKRIELTDMPDAKQDILASTEELMAIDYTEVLATLTEKQTAYENSVKQYDLVYHPSEEYVISCLEKVEAITKTTPLTPETDESGRMYDEWDKRDEEEFNGYVEEGLLDQEEWYTTGFANKYTTKINFYKGSKMAGWIEVYQHEMPAEDRIIELAEYSDLFPEVGKITKIGTVFIATSSVLSNTEQEALIDAITETLIELE